MGAVEGVVIGAAAALGLVVGSFLNVVVHRLPRGESIAFPGSRCPACGRPIRPWENVPVASWLLLRGRCAGCGGAISLRYPLVEATTGLLFAAIAWRYGLAPESLLWMAFGAGLFAAALIDLDHRIIPDAISLGGLVVGLVATPLVGRLGGLPLLEGAAHALLGALVGGGSLWLVGFLHARLAVALGRRFEHWPGEGEPPPRPHQADYWLWFPGMGLGDIKLLAAIGAFVGPLGVLETILVSSLLGLAGGGIWALASRQLSTPFGFGPAIALGALVVVLSPVSLVPVP